jgi:predicted  nucleic acid-binding Zn-ribbon protein
MHTGDIVTEDLRKLLRLQELDRRILQMAREGQDIPKRKSHIEEGLQQHQAAVEEAKRAQQQQQLKLKELEGDVEAFTVRLRKYREQQMTVKNNDEYRALDREIASTRRDITKFEDQELVIMEALEKSRAEVENRQNELQDQERLVSEELAVIEERLGTLDTEIEKLKAGRPALTKEIDAEWLNRYERILRNKGDFALVSVQNGACGGCHMSIPPQVVHDARRGQKLSACPYCGRILYCE